MAMARAMPLLLLFAAAAPALGLRLLAGRPARCGTRRAAAVVCAEQASGTSLRDQMKAYLDMVRRVPACGGVRPAALTGPAAPSRLQVKSTGRELTADQSRMIAEFEADEGLLEQTGRVDFGKAANPPAPPPPVDESGPGDFSRGYSRSTAPARAAPAPAADATFAAASPPPPPSRAPRPPVEEGPLVQAARAAQLEAARRAMLGDDDEDEPSDAVEMDPVTGLPVARSGAAYGEKGYGKGVGGASSNPRSYAPARPAPAPPPAVPIPAPPPPAPPAARAPPAPYAAPAAFAPAAPAPVAAASDAAAQKLWLLQRREWEAVEALLARQAANQPLQPVELRQLRDSIASIVLALSSL
jgi:hypothetical protein